MAPAPVHHPLHDSPDAAPMERALLGRPERALLGRRRSIAAHPAGKRPASAPRVDDPVDAAPRDATLVPAGTDDQSGSMTTEYGLIVVVGATICSLVIKWATGGAIFELLGGVLDAAAALVGF